MLVGEAVVGGGALLSGHADGAEAVGGDEDSDQLPPKTQKNADCLLIACSLIVNTC